MADDEPEKQQPAGVSEYVEEAGDGVVEKEAPEVTLEEGAKEDEGETQPAEASDVPKNEEALDEGVESKEGEMLQEGAREELDVIRLVSSAEAAMRSAGSPSAARSILDGALLEWEDVVREGLLEGEERAALEEKVVDLYMAYGHMERSLKQFRQAAKVYDTASQSAVASKSVKFWMDYAAFAIDRMKYDTARDLYSRALHVLQEEGDQATSPLWEGLVSLARTHLGQPTATLQSVRALVFPDEEEAAATVSPPAQKKAKLNVASSQSASIERRRDQLPLIFSSSFERRMSDRDDPEEIVTRAGLDSQTASEIFELAKEPTLVEVIEGCRVVAALQTAEIEETWASLRQDQARRLRQAPDVDSRRKCLAVFRKENEELEKNTKLELRRLNDGIQSILKVTGLPLLAKSDDPDLIATQRAVLQAALASHRNNNN